MHCLKDGCYHFEWIAITSVTVWCTGLPYSAVAHQSTYWIFSNLVEGIFYFNFFFFSSGCFQDSLSTLGFVLLLWGVLVQTPQVYCLELCDVPDRPSPCGNRQLEFIFLFNGYCFVLALVLQTTNL